MNTPEEWIAEARKTAKLYRGVGHNHGIERTLDGLADALEATTRTLNADIVLAALDQMLEPNTLHPGTHLSTMKLQAKKLRAHVAQYATTPATGEEPKR